MHVRAPPDTAGHATAAPAPLIGPGQGTPEPQWLAWGGLQALPAIEPAALLAPGGRLVVVAPHPDDEVLMAGGLLQRLAGGSAGMPVPLLLLAVTDGEASHAAASCRWPAQRLAAERPRESARALAVLGLPARAQPLRLRLPDGAVRAHVPRLAAQLEALLRPHDTVLTTWRHDGHPDHEATALACAAACAHTGARRVEVPVWAWHWARPGDARVPWQRARRIALRPGEIARKAAAMHAFTSQVEPDASTGAPPVLPASCLRRAARTFEVVFV